MAISNPVDIGTAAPAGSATSIVLTTTGTVSAGGRIFVEAGWFGNGITISSISDGSNTYAVHVTKQAGGNTCCAEASAEASAGLASGSTITINLSGSAADRKAAASYSTGVATGAGSFYGAVSQAQASNTAWSSTTTTVTSGDLLHGASHWEDGVAATDTPSGGNTQLHAAFGGSGNRFTTVYQIGTGAAIAASGTWSATSAGSEGTSSVAVAYKAATGGGTQAITPAAITSTSAMSGAVQKLAAVKPAAITSTSAMSGAVQALKQVKPSAITATSAVSGTVTKLGTKAIVPSAITSTSTVTGVVVKLASVRPSAINATSFLSGTVSGGTSNANPLRTLMGIGI